MLRPHQRSWNLFLVGRKVGCRAVAVPGTGLSNLAFQSFPFFFQLPERRAAKLGQCSFPTALASILTARAWSHPDKYAAANVLPSPRISLDLAPRVHCFYHTFVRRMRKFAPLTDPAGFLIRREFGNNG